MNVSSKYQVMIFRQDGQYGTSYTLGLSKKNTDGSYTNGYIPVHFKKDVSLDNKTNIYIKDAWLSFYKTKDKKTIPFIFINEFETIDQTLDRIKNENAQKSENIVQNTSKNNTEMSEIVQDPFVNFGNEVSLTDEELMSELPF